MQLGRCTDKMEPFSAFDNDTIPMYTCSTDQLFWVAWHAGTGIQTSAHKTRTCYLCTCLLLLWMLFS